MAVSASATLPLHHKGHNATQYVQHDTSFTATRFANCSNVLHLYAQMLASAWTHVGFGKDC